MLKDYYPVDVQIELSYYYCQLSFVAASYLAVLTSIRGISGTYAPRLAHS